jgi:hypothetical protein
VRRIPRSPVSFAAADQARRRRLPAKWLAAMLITTAVALLAPGVTYETAGRSSAATAATTAATSTTTTAAATTIVAAGATTAAAAAAAAAAAGCRGVTQMQLPANGFITNPSRVQGGHLWWHRSADGSVCIGTVIMWVQFNTAAARTWRVIVYSARHPGGLTVASRTFTLERGWHWRGFGVHRSLQDLSAVCVTATESFGMSCVQFSTPAG